MVSKRVAVTGGLGFLGSAVVNHARARGYQVWSFDRSSGQDILGDLDDLFGADTVIHLAGLLGTSELFDDAQRAVDVNVSGTLRILEWCRENNAGYVGILMPDVFPSVYTATKIAAHRLASAWHNAYGIPVSHVRAFNAFGSGQAYGAGHPQKIMPTFARAAWQGVPLPVWGDGEQTMDLVHVDDVAEILVDAVDFGSGEIFDAGTGTAVTVNQLANFVLRETGSKAGIEYLPMRPGEIPTHVVAGGAGWDLLGWHPALDWEDISATLNAYRDV